MEFNEKLAEKFADSALEKSVKYYIYCYYDKDLERFNQPQISEQAPEFVAESCISSIKKGKFKLTDCAGLVLVQMGDFDLVSGKFDLLEKPVLLVDCEKFVPKEVNGNA